MNAEEFAELARTEKWGTHKLTMYDPALWNAFVKQFGGENVRIVNVQDKIIDFSAEFHGVTVMYSDFCENAQHEIERIIDGMMERAKQQAELTKEQMLYALQYKSGMEVRDG
jgi:hypothetical protein